MNFSFTTDDPEDIYSHSFNKVYTLKKTPQEYYGERLIKDYAENFTWQDLYAKLDLEECILNLNSEQDFTSFYQRLELVGSSIKTFTLYITPESKLKSGYHYITAALTYLKNLRVLKIQSKLFGKFD